jgi:mycofactocin precursor
MNDEPTTSIPEDEQVVADVLVEEVSIDGMCGVY